MSNDTKILIVEDSRTQAERLSHLLETRGYGVTWARDGQQALARMREQLPELVVTDVVMPEMDGYTLCERIKSDERLRDTPVILLTSLTDPREVIRGLQCGADNFIRKPYDDAYLLSRVGNILTSRELRETGRFQVGLEVYLSGERHFISAERQQILDFLLSTYDEVAEVNKELSVQSERLREANVRLNAQNAELDAARKRAEELANLNNAVLDATTDGIGFIDHSGDRLRNAALTRMFDEIRGLPSEASIRESLEHLAPLTADPDGCLNFIASLASGGDAAHGVEIVESGRHLQLSATPVREDAGAQLGTMLVVRDVTHEREVERLKTELMATVSHELRTPLAAVLGFAELLLSPELDDETRKSYVEMIVSEARRLRDLVNDFLDLQRIEEGGFVPVLEPMELGEVLRHQIELFSAQSLDHTMTLDLAEEPLPVVGERDRLSQVLANLLSNAVKYTPEGGPIAVSAQKRTGLVEVRVRDSGLGIPHGQQDMIFEKFFRVDSSDTRRIGGTGLGLALCRSIIEAHGGEIGFESAEGEGSTFWFRLPASRAAASDGEVDHSPR